MLSVVMLNVILLCVIMLNVIVLSVVAPAQEYQKEQVQTNFKVFSYRLSPGTDKRTKH
jgi:hypothetical protein